MSVKLKVNIAGESDTPTIADERVPTREELAKMLRKATTRGRVAIALMAFSGLRPESLGDYLGKDGIRLSDFKEATIKPNGIEFQKTPTLLAIRKNLSKTRHQYFTFLTENGTNKLLAYLNDRIARGEILGPDSAVIAPDTNYKTYRGTNKGKKFIPTAKISKDIRKTLRPRFDWRPYIFRAYFDTQLLLAEPRGKMAHDFRVFFMGHKGSMESKYTTNKGVLPEALVEEMREAFMRSEELLDLELQTETLQEAENKTQQPAQMVIAIEKVEELIAQNWRLVATLPKNRAVVEKIGVRM